MKPAVEIGSKPVVKVAWSEDKDKDEEYKSGVEVNNDYSVDLGGLGPSNAENFDDVENSDNVDV